MRSRALATTLALLSGASCAKAPAEIDASAPQPDGSVTGDVDATSCGASCDEDGDGVPDGSDQCPGTSATELANEVGCADSQVDPELEPEFPPFGLAFTPTGDLGRAGGLTWNYTGIDRADLFHIYWLVCDDPATPCGVSLDGPLDVPAENWQFSSAGSDLPAGRVVFTNATQIPIADSTPRSLIGRLTLTIVDAGSAPLPFATVATLGVPARAGTHGAEIPGTGFQVAALAEVQDTITSTWTPYLDYYDAAPTPEGATATVSFGGSFYSE